MIDHKFYSNLNKNFSSNMKVKKFIKGEEEEEEEEESIDIKEELKKLPYLVDIKPIDIKDYQRHEKIGEGRLGKVIKISSKKTEELFAAKIFRYYRLVKDIFIKENIIHSHLSHPSILKYIGYSPFGFKKMKEAIIITEYCKNGTLFQLLEKERKFHNVDGWNDTMKLINAIGIAMAMEYLHSINILHRDLKTSNIFVDEYLHPLVGDFGISKVLNNDEEEIHEDYGECVGTPAYIAPEIFRENIYSKKSDVYSFSLVLYELFVGPLPFTNFTLHIMFYNVTVKKMRPKFNIKISPAIKNLIESCWNDDPQKRPSFKEIVNMLKINNDFITEEIDEKIYREYIQMIDEKIESIAKHKDVKQISADIQNSMLKNMSNNQENYQSINPKIEKIDSINDDVKKIPIKIDPNCTSCNEKFENKSDILYISGFKYHKNCVKCSICQKVLQSIEKIDEFICVTPGMFFCIEDYENYEKTKKLSSNVLIEYGNKMIKNFLKELSSPIFFNDAEYIEKFSQTDFFINPSMIENSFQFSKYYKYFVPTVTFHFSVLPSNKQIIEFIKLLPKSMMIVNIERGSILITIAFLGTNELHLTEEKYREIIEPLIPSLNTAMGESIIGQPMIQIPDDEKILDLLTQNSINLLQNAEVLNQINIDELKNEIYQILLRQTNKNWEFIYEHFDLFEIVEEKTNESIQKNGIELIIIGETIIADEFFDEYELIRNKINSNNEEETEYFLYHGTSLEKQSRIIQNHFLQPGLDKIEKRLDDGFYGKGIYATDNIFYASIYSKGYQPLRCNEKGTVLGCIGIFSQNHSEFINDLQFDGLTLPEDRVSHYGIHQALVGSANKRFYPILNERKDESFIVAKEFVFPNKFQIMPVISFIIKRTSFCIIWADELSQYSNHLQELRHAIDVNVYSVNSIENSKKLIEKKKRNVIKLIISSNKESWCKSVIKDARKIFDSNVVCLIYSEHQNHTNFAKSMKNVLFTDDVKYLKEFAELDMKLSKISDFSKKLGFNINESTILNFRNLMKFTNDFCFTHDLNRFNDLT